MTAAGGTRRTQAGARASVGTAGRAGARVSLETGGGAGAHALPGPGPARRSPSSLSSNTGLRAVAADMDELIRFFHLLHANSGRGCARASPESRRGWPGPGGCGAGGGEPGGAPALLPLRSAPPLLMARPGSAPQPGLGAWPSPGRSRAQGAERLAAPPAPGSALPGSWLRGLGGPSAGAEPGEGRGVERERDGPQRPHRGAVPEPPPTSERAQVRREGVPPALSGALGSREGVPTPGSSLIVASQF